MTTMPTLLAGHVPTAVELGTITTAITRNTPIKGIRITSSGNPIATTSGTTELDLSKYALTGLTLVTGRYYVARYLVTVTKTVSTDGFDFRLRVNTAVSGTQIGIYTYFAQDGSTMTKELQFAFVGDSSYTALYLSMLRTGGTGTASYYGTTSGFNRCFAALHDVGDTDNWSDVA